MEKKAYRGRMWKMMGKQPFVLGMWEYFLQERSRVKRFRELADAEKQAGIQGQAYHLKNGNWAEYKDTFKRKMKASEWAFWRTRRSHNVLPVPKLHKFPSGRLRLVGLLGTKNKVVVCNLWR